MDAPVGCTRIIKAPQQTADFLGVRSCDRSTDHDDSCISAETHEKEQQAAARWKHMNDICHVRDCVNGERFQKLYE
ncbi:unnamed protein product [Toxocara canis]|uniref:Uncharacterized protein n=1 Tax=Toxocara canis TaxID=6265 RepID=A0A183UBV7_TOXCA|nr:unnamed protein product [Toxocara canis]